jgi:malonyl-CoA/methylmalonyl-CoA synthetase
MASFADGPAAWAVHLPPGVAPEDLDLLADGSLVGRWRRRWSEDPERRQLQGVDGTWLSAGELEERTRAVARRLRAAGLGAGERFVLSGATCAELVIAYVGALRAGLLVVPINSAYTESEVRRIVHDARPAAGAVESERLAGWVRAACEQPIRLTGLDVELPAGDGGAEGIDGAGEHDPALLIYTSGTTGRPKGVPLTHGNLLASATAVNLAWRWEPDDRLLLTLPLFHVHGLGVGLNGSLCAGASVALAARFDPDEVAERAEQGATLFFGVPTMYHRLVESGRAERLRPLRLLVSGSAPLPAALADELKRRTGQLPLERYGMTETMMLTSNPYEGPRKAGTVGLPLPGVSVRLSDAGEVEVRGPNVIDGYYKRPEATAEAFTDEGWFRTGDIGERDEDGYLSLIGRSKELIISGGYNVYPREVEEVLGAHPDVHEVAVVGRPSERWGEEVTAVVVAERSVDAERLREYAAERLAPYKVPKRIEFTRELPRNAMGKLVRGDL